MTLGVDKSMLLATARILFAFRDDFSPDKGLFRISEIDGVEIAETTSENLIPPVEIESI
jgi:hypothetical protein